MRRWFIASLLALCAVALNAQGLEITTVANLPSCVDGSPWIVLVVDGASSTDCATGASTTEVVCTCKDGTIAGLSTSGGSSNSFVTMNVDNGTDPVADSSTDTLNLVSGTGITITGDSSTDTITIASTASAVVLDLDADGGTDSSGITQIESRNNYERVFADEPSADVLRLNGKPQDNYASECAFGNTPDDDFASGTLGAQWTAASGASGTVDLLETGNVSEYDLASSPGYLLTQAGLSATQEVHLRQDYTLPDGSSFIVKMLTNRSGLANGIGAGIAINSTDSNWESGTYLTIHLDQEGPQAARVISYDGTVIGPGSGTATYWQQSFPVIFWRILRDGLDYHTFYSDNGVTWNWVATKTFGSAADNVWIFHQSNGTNAGMKAAIIAWDWSCLGDNDMNPFN